MPRSRIAIVVVGLVVLVVAFTLVYSRYYLTPSWQQRIVEEQNLPTIVAGTAVP